MRQATAPVERQAQLCAHGTGDPFGPLIPAFYRAGSRLADIHGVLAAADARALQRHLPQPV